MVGAREVAAEALSAGEEDAKSGEPVTEEELTLARIVFATMGRGRLKIEPALLFKGVKLTFLVRCQHKPPSKLETDENQTKTCRLECL